MIIQKYQRGDHVHVVKDLGACMVHFESDCEAIVIASYKEQFDCGDTSQYTIHLKGRGDCAWYGEHQLELIEANRLDMLEKWEDDERQEEKKKANLDWIFKNGEDVLNAPHTASIAALARCFGLTNLWGSRGEGFVYFSNTARTLSFAKKFLLASDKDGWFKFCLINKMEEKKNDTKV